MGFLQKAGNFPKALAFSHILCHLPHFKILSPAPHISLHFFGFGTSATMSNGHQEEYSQNVEAADSWHGGQLTVSQMRHVSNSHQSQPTYVNPSGLVSTRVPINFFADSKEQYGHVQERSAGVSDVGSTSANSPHSHREMIERVTRDLASRNNLTAAARRHASTLTRGACKSCKSAKTRCEWPGGEACDRCRKRDTVCEPTEVLRSKARGMSAKLRSQNTSVQPASDNVGRPCRAE